MCYNKKIAKRLFSYKGKYWYKNIRRIPAYFRAMRYLIKNGYDEYATWETFDWFNNTMKDILTQYNKSRHGTPMVLEFEDPAELTDEWEGLNETEWNNIVNRMIDLLDSMDEDNEKYKDMEPYSEEKNVLIEKAKDEFFELFSKYYFCLWD